MLSQDSLTPKFLQIHNQLFCHFIIYVSISNFQEIDDRNMEGKEGRQHQPLTVIDFGIVTFLLDSKKSNHCNSCTSKIIDISLQRADLWSSDGVERSPMRMSQSEINAVILKKQQHITDN